MPDQFQERRRTPRCGLARTLELRLGRTVRVRVIDLSANGALLWTDEEVTAGTLGQLKLLLGGTHFSGQVRITREQPTQSVRGHLLGAVLTPLQPRQQRALEQFLGRRNSEAS